MSDAAFVIGGVSIAQVSKTRIDLTAAPRLMRNRVQFRGRGAADPEPQAVRRQDVELLDDVGGAALSTS